MSVFAFHPALPVLAAALGLLICYAGFGLLRRAATRFPNRTLPAALMRLREPALLAAPVIAAAVALPFAHLPALLGGLLHAAEILLIAAVAWACLRGFDIWREFLTRRYRLNVTDNLRARQVHTQALMLRRIFAGLIVVVALALILMTFPSVRALGATLFASAGVAGLVVGLAARPAITNLFAGLQVALTEPIRLDDVVIVQGEWGRIEEIRTTYVVVRIWDERRLIVPLSYFIEQPFQNWTRHSADLLGTVYVYVDYALPVEPVRRELLRILEASKQWDRKAWGLQVTNATAQTMELRALMSAANSGDAWDLRCLVREQLITFLQARYPQSLPLSRVRLQDPPDRPVPAEPPNASVSSSPPL